MRRGCVCSFKLKINIFPQTEDQWIPKPPYSEDFKLDPSSPHLSSWWHANLQLTWEGESEWRPRPSPLLPVCNAALLSVLFTSLVIPQIQWIPHHGYTAGRHGGMLLQPHRQVFLWDQWEEHQRPLAQTWLCDCHSGHGGLLHCHLFQPFGHRRHFKKPTLSLPHLLPVG